MFLFVDGINPEPWTAPSASVGRKGGRQFVQFYKSEALRSYQAAIKDSIERDYPDLKALSGAATLRFWFWRQLPSYEGKDAKQVRKHTADATNLQKALEDAIQGLVVKNDRQDRHVESEVVEQDWETNPFIAIEVCNWKKPKLPAEVAHRLANPVATPVYNNERDVQIEGIF